jgi:ATP-binding cassette, subfamily B, bacterial
MTGFRLKYLGATISLGISATSKTATYLLLRYFIDNFFGDGTPQFSLPLVASGFVMLALVEGGFTFMSGRLAAQTAEGTTRRLRNYLFDHIQHLPFFYHKRTETGELIQRSTSDVDALRRFYADQAIGVGRIVLLFTINFIAILNLNARLGLLSVVVVPLVVLVSIFFFRRVSKAYEAYQEQEAILSTTLQENLTGVRVVKAFARQQYEIGKFEQDNWEKYKRGKHLLLMHALFWPASDILCGVQILVGYFIGAMMAINGDDHPRHLPGLCRPDHLDHLADAQPGPPDRANVDRYGLVQPRDGHHQGKPRTDLDMACVHPAQRRKGDLKFENAGFYYEDDEESCAGRYQLPLQTGQVVALLGSTGSGKTTLVNLLPRFYDYTSGRILLDNVELTATHAATCASKSASSNRNRSCSRAPSAKISPTALPRSERRRN